MARLWDEFKNTSTGIKIAIVAVAAIWIVAVGAIITNLVILSERPIVAEPPEPGAATRSAAVSLEPSGGEANTVVTVHGQGWVPNSTVLIYLAAPGQIDTPAYAVASAVPDPEGEFMVSLVIPTGAGWENSGAARVVARAVEGEASAQAFFSFIGSGVTPPTETPVVLEPTPTPTTVIEPTATPTAVIQPPTATPAPGVPLATTTTDLNVRSGPGTAYPVLGLLRAGQSAEITGLSPDGGWWQIKFTGVADGRGWVAGRYVNAQNTGNIPIVQPPAPPPIPTPVVITDWQGEYFNNLNLAGNPVLVRNDAAVNFDWGSGAPAAGIGADNFSVRWSRGLNFSAGAYRFIVRVDDGVRLWVAGVLLIDQWRDTAPATYVADINLSDGVHQIRMDYYEHTGAALAQLSWERLETFPDWKGEYYNNPNLSGVPVLVRNDVGVNFNWGPAAPGPGVPADNFSARWTRQADFEAGTYLFQVKVDDGVRLWLDDALVIDAWQDGSPRLLEAERQVSAGQHRLRVEYYERSGGARIEVKWKKQDVPVNLPPQAVAGGPYRVNEGGLLAKRFDGRASKDPDGVIVKYEWDFNYTAGVFDVEATGATAIARYPDGPATVTLALRVTDDQRATGLATTQVTVLNVPPTAEAGGPYAGLVGNPITLAGTATDPGLIDQAGLTYRWDFGDGATGNGPVVSHVYAQPGTFTAQLTVTDKDGGQGADTAAVQVMPGNQTPQAVIDGPTGGLVGQALDFSGRNSSDADGYIVSYSWNFGDNTTGSGITVTHVFSQAGSYQVSLLVTDDDGLIDDAAQIVNVTATEPTPEAVSQKAGAASPKARAVVRPGYSAAR